MVDVDVNGGQWMVGGDHIDRTYIAGKRDGRFEGIYSLAPYSPLSLSLPW